MSNINKKAVILLSGGLDSATVLAIAQSAGYQCFALSFDYGQRHHIELSAAKNIAQLFAVKQHKVIEIDLTIFGGSALTDSDIKVPEASCQGIPPTYVPARNTILLSIALAWSEVVRAEAIFIGANAVDYSGYPDCRPEFIDAFNQLAKLATKIGLEDKEPIVYAPLINLSKADIIRRGVELGVDYSLTISCYQADHEGRACGRCDSCHLRQQGFLAAEIPDPTQYVVE